VIKHHLYGEQRAPDAEHKSRTHPLFRHGSAMLQK
jgi:hypothetical protein